MSHRDSHASCRFCRKQITEKVPGKEVVENVASILGDLNTGSPSTSTHNAETTLLI